MSLYDIARCCYYDPGYVLRTYGNDIAAGAALAIIFTAWGLS